MEDESKTPNTETDMGLEETRSTEMTSTPNEPVQEQMPEKNSQAQASSGGGKAVWVVLVVLALLIGGGIGYIFGNNDGSSNSGDEALQSQVDDLNRQLQEARDGASDSMLEEKDNEISELQQENARLEQENTDLREQLEDAEDDSSDTTTQQTPDASTN